MYQNCCKKCGSIDLFTEQKGNSTGLYCRYCGAWIKWLSKDELRALKNTKQDSNKLYTVVNKSGLFVKQTGQFELDWDKVKTFEDLKLIVKNWMNPNELTSVMINNGCKDYEKMKHLAKDEE